MGQSRIIIKLLIALFLSVPAISAYSQAEIISTATGHITSNKFALAEHYLDSILKKNSKCVDALVMKGNVLLNYAWQNTGEFYFDWDRAESIFDTSSTINSTFFTPIISNDTSKLIEHYWVEALRIDSTRIDIQKGLCNLYSVSLRVPELRAQLLRMKSTITSNPENAFVYADYARNLKARGKFEDGMAIYQLIADMFPQLAGIRCDMAGEYFYAGKMNLALQYLDSTLNEKVVDQTSFINSAGIYSTLGYYDEALKTLERYSVEDTVLISGFYRSLMQYARMDSGAYAGLQGFVKSAGEQNYWDEVYLGKKILQDAKYDSAIYTFAFAEFQNLLNDEHIPDYYKALVNQHILNRFKNRCAAFMNTGIFACRNKNYPAAVQYLDGAENCREDTETGTYALGICKSYNHSEDCFGKIKAYWLMVEGYALYMSGEKKKALETFRRVIDLHGSNSQPLFFDKQPAQYFAAKILAENGKKAEAAELFDEIAHAFSGTRYKYLAAYYQTTHK